MIGIHKEKYPRAIVLRGWDPTAPSTLSSSRPVASSDVDEVLSGMVIVASKTTNKWVLGAETHEPDAFVAFAQDHATDLDVVEADSLVGLTCHGKFRIATPHFMRQAATGTVAEPVADGDAYAYAVGTPITYALNDEIGITSSFVDGAWTEVGVSGKGKVRPAKAGEPVIGIIAESFTGINGNTDLTQTVCQARPLQLSPFNTVETGCLTENAYHVVIDTTYVISAPAAVVEDDTVTE